VVMVAGVTAGRCWGVLVVAEVTAGRCWVCWWWLGSLLTGAGQLQPEVGGQGLHIGGICMLFIGEGCGEWGGGGCSRLIG
jgi:hypothetical protein